MPCFPLSTLFQVITDERAQELIDKAMESGSLKQRNVVGVITGLMGSGKTTLLCHLFGEAPPDLYTSTGVAEKSLRGLLHHILHLSSGTWKRLSYENIRELLAPLIRAGVREADIDIFATRLMHKLGAKTGKPSLPTSNVTVPQVAPEEKVNPSPLLTPQVTEQSPSCQEIVPLVKTTTGPRATGPSEDLLLEFVHMIDTGGQPELIEVMPSLIHNANLAMVLVDLRYGLNERPPVSFHEAGVCHKHGLPSQYTGRDVVLKLVSTLHAKRSLNEAFRLLVIATHRDCVEKDLDSRVKALNDELRSLLLPAFEEELILFNTSDNKIAFVLDLKSPGTSDRDSLEVIRGEVGKPGLGGILKTPISFFVFEQDLLHFAENVAKRDILSLDECRQVGARLKMSGEVVEAALVLFHRQNTFLYFRHVLPNHVFVNPQVPFDVVNGIVRFSYKVSAGKVKGFTAKYVSQFKGGVITQELLNYDKISSHFQEGFYEIKDAIKLFCYTFTLAPLKPYSPKEKIVPVDEKKKEYLMMCLKPAIPYDKLHCHIPKTSDTVPLVMKFSSGCVPLGCFGSTISCLLFKYGWEVIKDKSPKCLAHNIAHLHDPRIPVNVVLVDFTQYIELHVEPDLDIHDSLVEVCSQVHSKVVGAIENVFNIMHLDTDLIKISSAVLCSICTKASEKHFAEFVNANRKYLLRCGFKYGKPNEKQLYWMGIDAASKDPLKNPTLPLLQRFPTKSGGVIKIIERIGTSNHDLGIHLLNDDYGTITASIEAQYKHDPPSRTTEGILQKWLQGTGRTPQTWDTFITVLREIELNTLAQEIEENLFNIQVQTQKKQTSHKSRKPSPQLKEEQTPDQSQKPPPELKEEQTPDQSQKPSPELKEKQAPDQSQKPPPELKEEQTPDQSQKPSPELKEEQTPDQSQKPSPELKEEQAPGQSQKPPPELKEEQTPDQSQKPSPELKEEQAPDQSQKPSPELKEEQTPDQSQIPSPELKEEQTQCSVCCCNVL